VSDTPAHSLADRTRLVTAGAKPVVGVHFLGSTAVFVLGEEELLFVDEAERRVPVHGGGILASTCDGGRIITGGDDGRVVESVSDGEHRVLATDEKKRWIDNVAIGTDGAIAWSSGKTAYVRTKKGELRKFEAASTVAGLCFLPKGFRLAIAHYNGATLWFPNAAGAQPERLEWKGSHMRMSGYSARVRSLSWSAEGEFLATSGSEQLILWPFDGKDGPMGRQPTILARAESRVVVVACHPRQPVVAVGYADGAVRLVRVEDDALILAREADGQPVSALGWNETGQALAFGTESGDAGLLAL